ncbi:MAG: hypothetical protein JO027_07670 [Solirubrobacterales bacterium]|nr:hypothetical protein [Solirubrobacterales bacterium]
MSIVIVLNIVLVALVIVGIVGGLAWSIASQDLDAPAGVKRSSRRRRRASARAQFIGRPADFRA